MRQVGHLQELYEKLLCVAGLRSAGSFHKLCARFRRDYLLRANLEGKMWFKTFGLEMDI